MENKSTYEEALEKLFDRANHDEYLGRSNKEKSLAFLRENTIFKDIIKEAIDKANRYDKLVKEEIEKNDQK